MHKFSVRVRWKNIICVPACAFCRLLPRDSSDHQIQGKKTLHVSDFNFRIAWKQPFAHQKRLRDLVFCDCLRDSRPEHGDIQDKSMETNFRNCWKHMFSWMQSQLFFSSFFPVDSCPFFFDQCSFNFSFCYKPCSQHDIWRSTMYNTRILHVLHINCDISSVRYNRRPSACIMEVDLGTNGRWSLWSCVVSRWASLWLQVPCLDGFHGSTRCSGVQGDRESQVKG